MGNTLQIKTLGGLSIAKNGEAISGFASRKAEALLVYLACNPRTHQREVLAELLWDDRSQRQALANLRVVLSSLRKEVGGYVEITRTTASLAPAAALSLDVAELEMAAERLRGQDSQVSSEVAEEMSAALDSYEGDFLEGFFLPEASAFEAWATAERERLHRLALEALLRLGRWHLEQGDYAAARATSSRLLELDPLAEAGHRQLMEALARSGQRSQALAQYETCREILVEELGVEPQEQTRALYEAVRSDALPGLRPPAEAEADGETIPHNLPVQPTPFYGRQKELAQLDEMLADPQTRLVTISGVGGTGKTRLAYAAAERQLERQPPYFADGVRAASLSSLDEREQLLPALAAALDFPLQDPAQDGRTELIQLTDYLQEKNVLLVLDNFEHLMAGAGLIGELVQGAPGLHLLVTSRERLNLREERVFPLAGFAADDGRDGLDAEKDPFVHLFLHSARRVRPDFELVPGDGEQLARLRQLTGGLPLAVELAASWVEVLPLAELAAEIRRDVDFLQTNLRDVPRRQRSMRAVFEASWRRLDPAHQAIFSRLSLFRGGFTRRAAQEVAGASLRDLASLSAGSLLQYEAGPDRYQIHELLRQFGRRKLQGWPEVEQETRRRHAAFYCRLLQQRGQEWFSERAQQALAELQPERGNMLRAWKWAVDQGDVSLMADALRGLCFYYAWRGYEGEALGLLRAASESLLAAPDKMHEDVDRRRLLVRILVWQVRFGHSAEQVLAALDQAETVLEELQREEIDVRSEEAFFAYWRGAAETDPLASRPYFERALSLYRAVGDAVGQAITTAALAEVEWDLGNYTEAAHLVQRALDGHNAIGNLSDMAHALMLLGRIEKHRGRLTAAREAHHQGYTLLREIGDRSAAAFWAEALASTLCWSGRFVDARAVIWDGAQLAEEVGSAVLTASLENAAAHACLHLGRYDEAGEYAERAATLARAAGDLQTVAWALNHSGMLRLVSGVTEESLVQLQEAATVLAQHRKSIWMLPLIFQAIALQQLSQRPEARRLLTQALRENMELRVFYVVANALPAAALLATDQGDVVRAVELYALASRYDFVANSHWFEDVVGQHVTAAAVALTDQEAAAARERGAALDLWETAEELLQELEDMEL